MLTQKFQQRPLYQHVRTRVPKHIRVLLCTIAAVVPYQVLSGPESYEQEFVITAYYSPLPNQCCYVKGGYDADKVLNGQGVRGADGTEVYPGMVAAPASYPFGTKIELPGVGVFTVHDRGGAINELDDNVHRLDIWVGHGEVGLARALELGLVRMRGTVYPPGSEQPATAFDMSTFQAPLEKLRQFRLADTNLLDVAPQVNDFSYSTVMLQEKLQSLGYFDHAVTGKYGRLTQQALEQFIRDYKVGETPTKLTPKTAAFLLAALQRKDAGTPITDNVNSQAAPTTIQEAQRILRFLGYYRGRTDGVYSRELAAAILQFQQEHWLVGTWEDPGAGQIGPITMKHLRALWDRTLVAKRAQKLLLLKRVKDHIQDNGSIRQFLREGYNGPQVTLLQTMLAKRGFFPEDKINGNFGPLTRQSVIEFQMDRAIVTSPHERGAGVVGPKTLSVLRQEKMKSMYSLVRAEGMRVL